VIVHTPSNSLLLNVPDPFAIREVLASQSKLLPHPQYNIAVKHTLEAPRSCATWASTRRRRSATSTSWPGKFKPFDHQIVMSEFLTLHRRAFNLSEMGTAKTNAALWAADWLMKTGRVRKVLVLSPLSTIERVWANDIFDTLMHRRCAILHGDDRQAALPAQHRRRLLHHEPRRAAN
jgi:hypothetical protein